MGVGNAALYEGQGQDPQSGNTGQIHRGQQEAAHMDTEASCSPTFTQSFQ